MTETETKWSERVKEWKASGHSAKAFAQGRDFKPSTLTYWAYRLRQVAVPSVAPALVQEPETRGTPTPGVRMIRVRRTTGGPSLTQTGAEPTRSNAVMVIAIGAARIEVRPGFDRGLLGELVEALAGAR